MAGRITLWLHTAILLLCCLPCLSWAVKKPDANSAPVACNQPYALCTSATCLPIPGVKDKSVCFCNVFNGVSMGNVSCEKRKLVNSPHGYTQITSSFSFENSAVNHMTQCPAGHPWTFCLDKPCVIDPRNANQAVCTCDIIHTGAYVTVGGRCDKSTCSDTLYSGATMKQLEQGTQVLLKALNLKTTPVTLCPK